MLYRLRLKAVALRYDIPVFIEWANDHLRVFVFICGGLPTHDLQAALHGWLTRAGLANTAGIQVHPRAGTTLALPYRGATACRRCLGATFLLTPVGKPIPATKAFTGIKRIDGEDLEVLRL